MNEQIEIYPPMIELTNYCNDKGYNIIPEKKGKKFIAMVFKGESFLKKGEQFFESDFQCQKESYKKIYKALCQ